MYCADRDEDLLLDFDCSLSFICCYVTVHVDM